MRVRELFLYQFKNYAGNEFLFDQQIVCITGRNGSGKTNLLDAIYFLCFTKSYFVHSDAYCVMNEKAGMRIRALFETPQQQTVQCILRENGKKEFGLNGVLYTQLSKHIGHFPVVIITPDDTQLITEGSEVRRKFIDILISQLDEHYMRNLMKYNKILLQRNALLKRWPESVHKDFTVLDIYDQQLGELAAPIFMARKQYAEQLKFKTNQIYHTISDEKEDIEIAYHSQLLQHSLSELLIQNRHKDIMSQRSNYGIHKDDLLFTLHNMPLKTVASQGQRKSFLFGLKFAQYEILKENLVLSPLLLLDDIFEKLDEKRGRKLIAYIARQSTQVFITDTHKERLHKAFEHEGLNIQWIDL
ncbi:MAG: DNA replication and repair protein RecF [Chitinophagaceae bacterium]|nr:DNA replication and repair protein RecF [Chitinophagaceae bacterium]